MGRTGAGRRHLPDNRRGRAVGHAFRLCQDGFLLAWWSNSRFLVFLGSLRVGEGPYGGCDIGGDWDH